MIETYLSHLTKEEVMAKVKASILLICVMFIASCSSGITASKIKADVGTQVIRNGCHGMIHHDHAKDLPGCYAVSSMKPGKAFDTQANFAYFKACGRPCWLPIYHQSALIKGTVVTKGHPCEFYLPSTRSGYCEAKTLPADTVSVICQVHGKLPAGMRGETALTDDAGHSSDIWDQIVVPLEDFTGDKTGLKASPDGEGYLAFGSDLWLENTGWHNIPCK